MNPSSAATLGRVNWRKLWLTVVVVYVVNRGLSFLIHRVWLGETYGSLGNIWPLEMFERQWIPFVTVAVWCFFFVYLFAKGCEGKGLAEGARFGAIIGLFVSVRGAHDLYVLLPVPYSLALKWLLAGMVTLIIMGIVAARGYQPSGSS